MNQNHKFFLSLLDEAVAFEDAPGECLEEVWDRCLEIIHEAGDRAARLGLSQLVEKSRQFRQWATPGQAKAFLAECLAALPQSPYLDSQRAADYLGVSVKSLYSQVELGRLKPMRGPRNAYRFTTKQLDAFLRT
ncbi:MAG: helix-turn-helix domain-containing protein [Thermoguttaceae bacterium]|jgi:hypothetical protein